jgi:hypothetical protein
MGVPELAVQPALFAPVAGSQAAHSPVFKHCDLPANGVQLASFVQPWHCLLVVLQMGVVGVVHMALVEHEQ